jgi:hypothetical protein
VHSPPQRFSLDEKKCSFWWSQSEKGEIGKCNIGKIEKTSINFPLRSEKAIKRISIQPRRRQREVYDVILRHFSANLILKIFSTGKREKLFSSSSFFLGE